ncbi:hypothetical protein ACWD3J_33215 [Streptomyces sp. NPDC002755]|uniref:hypothetical protein n=1 Tax=Streptomyces sp. NPDC002884 TaxID=3154544 RepID=UPI003320C3B7
MARDLKKVDEDLKILEDNTRTRNTQVDTSISGIRTTLGTHTTNITGINTKLGTQATDITKLQQSYKGLRTTHSGISTSLSLMSNSIAAHTNGLTGLAASLTLLTVGLSIFKVDEKGITILGATREFPWKKKIDELQKKIESQTQTTDREKKERRDKLIDDNYQYIDNLKETEQTVVKLKQRIEVARNAADTERSRLEADPRMRTDRGIDAPVPVVRGVASEVTVLRRALQELTAAF